MSTFECIMQHDSMECGIACLAMVCNYYGKNFSFKYLDAVCHSTTEGISMLGLSDAASTLGLHSVGAKVGIKELSDLPLPCILHWNQNHFVVLYNPTLTPTNKFRQFFKGSFDVNA